MRIRVFRDLHSINKDKTNLNMAQNRSDYFFSLDSYSKSRYEKMLIAINLSIDPFSIMSLNLVKASKSGQIIYMKLFFRILSCFLCCIQRKTSKHKNPRNLRVRAEWISN